MTNPFKKKEKKELTAKELIEKRESLIEEIKKSWELLYTNNIYKGTESPKYDLLNVYKSISEKELELIKVKLSINAVNFGFSTLKSMPENNAYTQIYLLQQLAERKVKLTKLPTKTDKNEKAVITDTFVKKEAIQLKYQAEKIKQQLDEFNSVAKFAA